MRELAARANTTSSTINKLEKGITRLNTDWLTRLAAALEVNLQELVKSSDLDMTTQRDDVEPYAAEDLQGFVTVLGDRDKSQKNAYLGGYLPMQSRYIVKSYVLDQIGIYPDSILIIDSSPDEINRVEAGSIVIAKLHENGRNVIVLRQFLPPSILVANSSRQLPPVINTRLQDATINGVVIASIRRYKPSKSDDK